MVLFPIPVLLSREPVSSVRVYRLREGVAAHRFFRSGTLTRCRPGKTQTKYVSAAVLCLRRRAYSSRYVFLSSDNIPARSSSDSCRHLRMSKGYQKVGFNRQLPEYRTP
jgi:hypothetical protein